MPAARLGLWLLSAGALAGGALSTLTGRLRPFELGLAILGLLTYATLGVFWPQWGMYGEAWARGDGHARSVALTFDDGPHPVSTRDILDILRQHDARATFFVLGHKVDRYPDVVREIHAAGHTIGIHGYEHDRLFSLRTAKFAAAQIERTRTAILRACGVSSTLFRPPVGFASHSTFRAAERTGVELIAWSVRSLDGIASAVPSRVAARVVRHLQNGAIVVLHDAAEKDDFTPAAIAALPTVLRALRERGYDMVTVSAMLADAAQTAASSPEAPSTKRRS